MISPIYREATISRLKSVGTYKINRFSSRAMGSASENHVVMVVSVMVCCMRESTRSQMSAAEFMGFLLLSRSNVCRGSPATAR